MRTGAAVRRARYAAAALLVLVAIGAPAAAQDAMRGQTLFNNTRGVTGKPVGNCIACHANIAALRDMIRNRGGKPDDARSVRTVLERAIAGAQPGAANAKAQYRGVLAARDLTDLSAYIAGAKAAGLTAPLAQVRP